MRLQHTAFQVFYMRLVRAQQSNAQFCIQTAQQESGKLTTHGNSAAIHDQFLLSLRVPVVHFVHIISYRLPGVKNPVV